MRTSRKTKKLLYGIFLLILLALLLRSCGMGGNFYSALDDHDPPVAPVNQAEPALISHDEPQASPLSGEKRPSAARPDKIGPLALDASQDRGADNLQAIGARTERPPEKPHTAPKKKAPANAPGEEQQTSAGIKEEPPELSQDHLRVNSTEALGSTFIEPIAGIKFILVKGGCYQMGSDYEQVFEGPMHEVCVDDFYLSKYEVTQMQWLILMGRTLSHFYFQGNSHPAEWVNWGEAQDFIRELNGRSEMTFRLPTEAEWEYAARSGGQDERYAGTNDEDSLEDFAWYRANSNGQTRFIGSKKPNGFGLHDMSGNVREWCSDWYSNNYYGNSPRDNPQGPGKGEYRVIRGGGWGLPRGLARTTYRDAAKPNLRRNDIGFRLALSVK